MSSSASHPHGSSTHAAPKSSSGPAGPNRSKAIPSADNQPTVISSRPPISTTQSSQDKTSRHQEIIKPGTRLGDIELTEHIGGGGMGQVYKGDDKRLGRPVAVKVLARDQSTDQDSVRRFLNEARSAARLNHQNIAQVYFAGEAEEHPYIVFEYVHGVNLRTMLEEHGPLMLEEALSYTLQIADALAHAAERRIVHRDVKPSNVLITPNGQAKLIDLGLARLSEPGAAEGDLTASGVTLGTFDYISPEQARDPRNADSRSDIYSLGCTLFFMLAGRPPFPEGTVLQKLLQHQGDTPPDVCQFRPDLPEEVGHVLGKMMAKDPRRRYPDTTRLTEALLTLADMIGLHPTGPAQAIWLPPQESRISVIHRQTPWLAPIMTLTCLIIGLHLLWSTQEKAGDIDVITRLGRPAISSDTATGLESPPPPGKTQPLEGETSDSDAPSSNPSGQEASPSLLKASTSPTPRSLPHEAADATTTAPEIALLAPSLATSFSVAPYSAGISLPSVQGTIAGGLSALSTPPDETRVTNMTISRAVSAAPLVITPSPQDDHQYRTIAASLAANPTADLIELRYDGKQIEEPISVIGRRLTIRSSPNHKPILAFEPSSSDPVLCPRDMIQVSDGKVTIEGVDVELDIPRNMPSDSWALVRLAPEGRVAFKACSLRVRNASDEHGAFYRDVVFIRATSLLPGLPDLPASARGDRESDIELQDCHAFGEAGFVGVAEDRPLRMTWINGLLAITEPAFLIAGSNRSPSLEAKTEIKWEHVTAVLRGPLIHIGLAAHRPHVAPVNFLDTSCVFGTRCLIQADVVGPPSDFLGLLSWTSKSSVMQESVSTSEEGLTALSVSSAVGTDLDEDKVKDWRKTSTLPTEAPRLEWLGGSSDTPLNSKTVGDFKLNLSEIGVPLEAGPPPGFQFDEEEVESKPAASSSE